MHKDCAAWHACLHDLLEWGPVQVTHPEDTHNFVPAVVDQLKVIPKAHYHSVGIFKDF